jgi:predicted metal-dependent phosphoesterase TrpH
VRANPGRIDLHVHSDGSDGRHPPEEVLRRAARGRLDVLALTDHDLAPRLEAGVHVLEGHAVRVLHAAEVSGSHEGREYHLLVYFPGVMPEAYRAFLGGRAAARAERYDDAVAALGLRDVLAPSDAAARAGARALTRHHLVRALRDAGQVADSRAGFARVAGVLAPIALPFLEAIAVARDAGGFPSWAHPDLADAQAHVRAFAAAGLRGLEGARPRQPRALRNGLRKLAERHGLLVTGGSDWHGWHEGELGMFALDGERAERFMTALERAA